MPNTKSVPVNQYTLDGKYCINEIIKSANKK